MKRRQLLQAMAVGPWLLPALASATDSLVFTFGQTPPATQVRKVFAAGAPAAVLLCCLAPEKMLGWPWPLDEDKRSLLSPVVRDLPMIGRLAGRGSTVPLETLVALAPDLILDVGEADATYQSLALRTSEQTGLPWLLVDGRLEESPRQLREAAARLGVQVRGERLAQYAEAILMRARNHGAALGPVYLARGHDGLETGLGGSIHAEAVELAGLENVAARLGSGGLARISLEQLLDWQPHSLLCQDANLYRHIRQSSLWQALPAVREGRVYSVPQSPFGWLDGPPGLNRLLGLEWLAAFDPKHAGALPQRVREFFALFYGMQLDEAQLQRLLAGHPGSAHG